MDGSMFDGVFSAILLAAVLCFVVGGSCGVGAAWLWSNYDVSISVQATETDSEEK